MSDVSFTVRADPPRAAPTRISNMAPPNVPGGDGATMAQDMTFLESDQVSWCVTWCGVIDLLVLEQENSLLSDEKCMRRDPGEI